MDETLCLSAEEQDPIKLLALTQEIARLLERKEQRLKGKRRPEHPAWSAADFKSLPGSPVYPSIPPWAATTPTLAPALPCRSGSLVAFCSRSPRMSPPRSERSSKRNISLINVGQRVRLGTRWRLCSGWEISQKVLAVRLRCSGEGLVQIARGSSVLLRFAFDSRDRSKPACSKIHAPHGSHSTDRRMNRLAFHTAGGWRFPRSMGIML